jgi:hypothetical protein
MDEPKTGADITDGTKVRNVPIVHEVPDDLSTLFANHFVAQGDDHFVTALFFEIRPPVVLSDAQKATLVQEIKDIKARCVARILITPELARGMIRALQSQIPKGESDRLGGEDAQ